LLVNGRFWSQLTDYNSNIGEIRIFAIGYSCRWDKCSIKSSRLWFRINKYRYSKSTDFITIWNRFWIYQENLESIVWTTFDLHQVLHPFHRNWITIFYSREYSVLIFSNNRTLFYIIFIFWLVKSGYTAKNGCWFTRSYNGLKNYWTIFNKSYINKLHLRLEECLYLVFPTHIGSSYKYQNSYHWLNIILYYCN